VFKAQSAKVPRVICFENLRALNASASQRPIIPRDHPEFWPTGDVSKVQVAATRQQLPAARYTQIAHTIVSSHAIDLERNRKNLDRKVKDLDMKVRTMTTSRRTLERE
jgi:hypothetical protein